MINNSVEPVSLICIDTRIESEINIQDVLIAQKMTEQIGSDEFYIPNTIINRMAINQNRFFSKRDPNFNIMLALNDILNYGYLLGVRAEREKRANKKGME